MEAVEYWMGLRFRLRRFGGCKALRLRARWGDGCVPVRTVYCVPFARGFTPGVGRVCTGPGRKRDFTRGHKTRKIQLALNLQASRTVPSRLPPQTDKTSPQP